MPDIDGKYTLWYVQNKVYETAINGKHYNSGLGLRFLLSENILWNWSLREKTSMEPIS